MAKRQTFTTGSTNPQTDKTLNDNQLNVAWDPLQVLKAEILNGVLYQMSASSFDSSNEIANALTAFGVALDPNDNSQLAALLQQLRQTSLVFKGYVSTTEPNPATYDLLAGNMWINSNGMPTTFPVPATDIKIWNGTTWGTTTDTYSPSPLDAFRNIDLNNGYYWFGGAWVIMSTDLSPDDFVLGADGLWRIKNSVQLRGLPTVASAPTGNMGIVNKQYVDTIQTTINTALNLKAPLASPAFSGTPTAPTAAAGTNNTQLANTAFVQTAVATGTTGLGLPTGAILPFAGTVAPIGTLICDGAQLNTTTYNPLFNTIEYLYTPGGGYAFTPAGVSTPVFYTKTIPTLGTGPVEAFDSEGNSLGEISWEVGPQYRASWLSQPNIVSRREAQDKSTFNIPDLDGYIPWYDSNAAIGSTSNGGVPNIIGRVDLTGQNTTTTPRFNLTNVEGSALYNTQQITSGRYHTDSASGTGYNRIEIDASRSNPIYGASTYVLPRNLKVLYCIKF